MRVTITAGDVLREGDAEVVEEHGSHADAGGHALVLREAGDKHAHGNQRRAQQEEGQQRAVGGGQIHVAELGEEQGIEGDDRQRDQEQDQQRQILAQYHLNRGDGQCVEQLIGLLLALLGDDPHGQDGHQHRENQTGVAQDILEVTDCALEVILHGPDAHKGQQKGPEDVGRQGMEMAAQLMLEHGNH